MNTSFNRLFAMMWMLIGFGLSAETVAQSLPAQLKPADFAYGVQIDTVGMQPVQSVVLPPEVYDHLTRDDLGDMRVFNTDGVSVPHALDIPSRYLSSQQYNTSDSAYAAIERHWADLPLEPDEQGVFVGTIPGTIPADYVEIELPEAQSLVRINVESADDPDGPWVHHFSGLAYNLQAGEENRESPPIAIYRNTHRYWRMTVDDNGAGALVETPSLRFGWIPARLLFVTQGQPPYTLAFGNGAVEPAGFSARELFQPMSADFAAIKDMPLASTGELATLGGKKRLERTREVKWQQFALWGSMILGVLVLGTLAVRLLRSLPEDNQTES